MAALLAGQGVTEVATQYNLTPSTVSRWRARIEPAKLQAVATKSGEDFDALMFDFLREAITTAKVQMVHARDTAWLKEQSAGELAVLFGVGVDKVIRILGALERPSDP